MLVKFRQVQWYPSPNMRLVRIHSLAQVVVLVMHSLSRAVWPRNGIASHQADPPTPFPETVDFDSRLPRSHPQDSVVVMPKSATAFGRIFTIGQGRHSLATLSEQLRTAGVTYVVDVRSTPYSRHEPEFARQHLDLSFRGDTLRYVYLGNLLGGRPADPDCYSDGRVDYGKTRTKDFFKRGIERLTAAYERGLSICLLCSEGNPGQCHRSKLIGVALSEKGIEVVHLLPDGTKRTQAEVIAELTEGQGELFPTHFMSRKQYRPVQGL